MTTNGMFSLGVTFHSFTTEYCSLQWSFEDMMQLASVLGGGVEIVGPAHHRCFPDVSDEFERVFKSAVERYGVTPTCYGTYADPFMLPARDLNDEELTEYTLRQLRGAVKLGFPLARLQYFASTIVERVLPYAERHGLKLAYELHAPLDLGSGATQRLVGQIRRIGSPLLGIIPDAGIFARSVPMFARENALKAGVPPAIVNRALELWNAKKPLGESKSMLLSEGASERQFVSVERFWGSFGHSDPAGLKELMPHVMHVHGKFFSMAAGDEPDIRYADLARALVANGYSGWVSSEYEGPPVDSSFRIVREHQAMIRRYASMQTR